MSIRQHAGILLQSQAMGQRWRREHWRSTENTVRGAAIASTIPAETTSEHRPIMHPSPRRRRPINTFPGEGHLPVPTRKRLAVLRIVADPLPRMDLRNKGAAIIT